MSDGVDDQLQFVPTDLFLEVVICRGNDGCGALVATTCVDDHVRWHYRMTNVEFHASRWLSSIGAK